MHNKSTHIHTRLGVEIHLQDLFPCSLLFRRQEQFAKTVTTEPAVALAKAELINYTVRVIASVLLIVMMKTIFQSW
jgi:hypothetical protein